MTSSVTSSPAPTSSQSSRARPSRYASRPPAAPLLRPERAPAPSLAAYPRHSPSQAAISRPFDGFVMPALSAEEKASGPAGGPARARATESPDLAPPRNAHEFARTWRRACTTPAARLAYLRLIEPSALGGLFRAELEASVLDGIAGALHLGVVGRGGDAEARAVGPGRGVRSSIPPAHRRVARAQADAAWAVEVLHAASATPRLSLSIDMADAATVPALREVFDAIGELLGPAGGGATAGSSAEAEDDAPAAKARRARAAFGV